MYVYKTPISTIWIDLEMIILSEISEKEKDITIWYHLYVDSKMQYK